MDAGAASAIAAWYAAILATAIAVAGGIMQLRARRARIQLRTYVVWSPQRDGQFKPRLHIEAVNMSQRNLFVDQWIAEQHGGPTLAGSPYEGRIQGPDVLQPGQLHGWDIPLDVPSATFRLDIPIIVTVRVTTGERFSAEPINPQPPALPTPR